MHQVWFPLLNSPFSTDYNYILEVFHYGVDSSSWWRWKELQMLTFWQWRSNYLASNSRTKPRKPTKLKYKVISFKPWLKEVSMPSPMPNSATSSTTSKLIGYSLAYCIATDNGQLHQQHQDRKLPSEMRQLMTMLCQSTKYHCWTWSKETLVVSFRSRAKCMPTSRNDFGREVWTSHIKLTLLFLIAMTMCLSNISGSGSLGLLLHHVSCYCHVFSIAYVVTSPVSFQLLSLNTPRMFIGGPYEGR